MVSISLVYDSATRTLTLTSSESDGNAGTTIDTNSVNITVTGIPSGWTAQLDYGVRVRNNKGVVVSPYQILSIDDADPTTGTVTVDNSILYATLKDNKLPVQLVVTDLSSNMVTASRNIVVLDVADAIDSTGSILSIYRATIQEAYISSSISGTKITFHQLDGNIDELDLGTNVQKTLSAGSRIEIIPGETTDEIRTKDPLTAFQSTPDNSNYVGEKLIKDSLDDKQDKRLVASFQPIPDDEHYPSEKLLKDNLDLLGTASTRDVGTSAGNVPVLNVNGQLPDGVIPPIAINEYAGAVPLRSDLVTLSTTPSGRETGRGDWAIVYGETGESAGQNGSYILNGDDYSVLSSWIQMYAVGGEGGTVYSVNGRTGIVTLSSSDVGLGNCDNTSDADKPISIAQAAANATFQLLSRMRTSFQIIPDDIHYISEKLAYDQLALKQPMLTAGDRIMIDEDNVISAQIYIPESGGTTSWYLSSDGVVTSDPPVTDVNMEYVLIGTAVTTDDAVYIPADGLVISPTSTYIIYMYLTSLVLNTQYTISYRAYHSGQNILLGTYTFSATSVNSYISFPGINQLTVPYTVSAGENIMIETQISKGTANTASIFMSSTPTLPTMIIRNGGNISAESVIYDKDGTLISQSEVNQELYTGKQDNLAPATVITLLSTGWSGNTQTVSVTGLSASTVNFYSPTIVSFLDYNEFGIRVSAEGTGSVTFTCNTVPDVDIGVNVVIA
ncbi:MAG: hypothetical protein WCR24_04020 [Candidatus Methanomethylophilaceae archaeon]